MRGINKVGALALLGIAVGLGGVGIGQSAANAHADQSAALADTRAESGTILFHLTFDRNQRVLATTALNTAEQTAQQGKNVIVLLNAEAAYYANSKLRREIKLKDDRPVVDVLNNIISSGAQVWVTRLAFEESGIRPSDLNPGITMVDTSRVAEQLTSGCTVISY